MFALRPQPFFQYVPTESISYHVPMKRRSVCQLDTPVPAKQPPTRSKSDAAKERYLRAIAEQKAARKAYADALAEEELSKLEVQLDAPKPVQEDPAAQLLRAFGLAAIDHSEPDLFSVAQEQRRRCVLEEQRKVLEEQRRRAEEERHRAAEERVRAHQEQEQLHARRAAEEQIRARRATEEQARARRAAEEQRRAALEEQQARQREFARAQALAYAQAVRAALDAEEAERVRQASSRKLGHATPEPSKTPVALTDIAAEAAPKKKSVSFSVPVAATTTPATPIRVTTGSNDKKGKRSTALPALPTDPLAAIAHLERAFDAERNSFTLPSALDFGAQGGLTFTQRNAPVHAYEHALGRLLTQLDAVESDGEESIRGERKRVVQRVEGELEGVEGCVKALWEAEHPAPATPAVEDTHVEEDIAEAAPNLVEDAVVAAGEASLSLEGAVTEEAQAVDTAELPEEFVELAAPVIAKEHAPIDDSTIAADQAPVSLEVAVTHESQPAAVTGFIVDEPIAAVATEEQEPTAHASPADLEASTTLPPAVGAAPAQALAETSAAEDPAAVEGVGSDSEAEVSSVSDVSEHSEEGYELVY